jgi:hypothetical protein
VGSKGDWQFEVLGQDEHRLTITARSVKPELLRGELGVLKIMDALGIRRKKPIEFAGITPHMTKWT